MRKSLQQAPTACLFVVLMARVLCGQAGVLTVVAGGNTTRVVRDGEVATSGSLSFPTSVTLDSSGNVYIADGYVRRVNSAGIISAVAGSNNPTASAGAEGIPALTAPVNAKAVALDNAGNVYIAEPTRIRR